jgi:hypothetical protein
VLWRTAYSNVHVSLVGLTSTGPLVGGIGIGTNPFGTGVIAKNDRFLAQFDSADSVVWVRTFTSTDASIRSAVPVPGGGVVLAGANVSSAIDFGQGPIQGPSVFIAKLASDGATQWIKSFTNENRSGYLTYPNTIALDAASGTIALAGWLHGAIDFGAPLPITASSSRGNGFVAEFDAMGNSLRSWQFDDKDGAGAAASAFDTQGRLMLAGLFEGSLKWCARELVSRGGNDAFVVELP